MPGSIPARPNRAPRSITHGGSAKSATATCAALHLPALVAIKHEPNVKAFRSKLIAAGKRPMQAVVAVMRKFLHAIRGMLKHHQNFDGSIFFKLTANTA